MLLGSPVRGTHSIQSSILLGRARRADIFLLFVFQHSAVVATTVIRCPRARRALEFFQLDRHVAAFGHAFSEPFVLGPQSFSLLSPRASSSSLVRLRRR